MKSAIQIATLLALMFLSVATFAQDKYAILIGVEAYDTGTFENLDYASEDAVELGKALEALDFTTTVMTSESEDTRLRPSTPRKMLDKINAVMRSCGNGDTLIISLSGHGVQFSDEDLLENRVRETYFCPSDADLSDKASLVKISEIVRLLNESPASRKLLLVDACQENRLSPEGKSKSGRRIELESVHENRRSIPGGMDVLFSCMSGQFSWEHEKIEHSVFTYHVIQYLQGKAESRFYESEKLDLAGLVYFVEKRTNDYVIENNLSADGQSPVRRGGSSNWPLGTIESTTLVNSLGMELVEIPAGTFMMGSPETEEGRDDHETLHEVEITKPFYMATTEITKGQFAEFIRVSGYRTEAEEDGEGGYGWNESEDKFEGPDPKYNWKNTGFRYEDDHPVVNVSWNDAVEFCKWLSEKEGKEYRLPTEAEWEYACRAGSTDRFFFGNKENDLVKYSNVADSSLKRKYAGASWALSERDGYAFSAPVGSFKPNKFGLYDMHGNVWEWCKDWYGSEYYDESPKRDPKGPSIGSWRVLRGGSWDFNPGCTRCAFRYFNMPSCRSFYRGFRVVLLR